MIPLVHYRWSTQLEDFCTRLLSKDPAERLGMGTDGFAEISGHAWFASIDWDKLNAKEVKPPFKPSISAKMFKSDPTIQSHEDIGDKNRKAVEGKDKYDGFTYVNTTSAADGAATAEGGAEEQT